MKMIVVISLEEYADKLRKLFFENRVPAYSESPIANFKMFDNDESINWFAHRKESIDGQILFTFLPEDESAKLINNIEKFSKECDCENPIRVFQLGVEKYFVG